MNFRLTLTLVILLALVTAVYLCIPSKKTETDTATVSTLFTPKPGDIQSITYQQDGADRYKFVKQGDQWKMTYPVNTNVDNDQLNPIAAGLGSISYRRKFEPESTGERSPEATGTNKPHNILKFTDTTGHEFTLALGKRGNDNASVFATAGASTIYLLDSNPLERIDQRSPDNFRNKTVKRVDDLKIKAIDIHSKDGDVKLTKSGDNWLINAPVNARANTAAISEILAEFRQIQAQGFSKLPKDTAGLKPPVATVTVWVEDQPTSAPSTSAATSASRPAATPITLELGYATDLFDRDRSPVNASLSDSNEVFTLRHESFTKLTKTLKDLRDPAVTPAPVTGATNITITGEGTSLVLDKKDVNWSLTSGSLNVGADAISIGDYLGLIRDLRAINYVDHAGDLKSIGLDPPRMKIDLSLPGQSQREILLVGAPESAESAEKVTPVMRQGEPTVYLIPTLEAKRLTVSALDFRDRSVDRLTADRIRTITISGPGSLDSGKGVTLQREATRWIVKGQDSAMPATTPATSTAPAKSPAAPVVDEIKISSLLADFTPLSATKYLAEKVDVSGTPTITVTLDVLESTIAPPSPTTAPVTTAPSSAPATTSAPATMATTAPASLPSIFGAISSGTAGPDPGKLITRTLKIYKVESPASAPASGPAPSTTPAPTVTWKAVWDGQDPEWTFEPSAQLIDRLSKETYVMPPAASQPATRPALGQL